MKSTKYSRRHALVALASGLLSSKAIAAGELLTPRQSEGPFYPVKLPPEVDNNLADLASNKATGQIINLSGAVLSPDKKPISGATVGIWQANHWGRYNHPGDRSDRQRDPHFLGFGQSLSDEAGFYNFRTIKPGSYGGSFFQRTPHIHFKVHGPGFESLTTQMYFAGEELNQKDSLLQSLRDNQAKNQLIVQFSPQGNNELVGQFNIIIGV